MKKHGNKVDIARSGNRWLMVFYDTLVYVSCWLSVFGLFKQLRASMFFYTLIGYVLFIGARIGFRVYKTVLRYGSVNVFARLICADAIATAILIAISFLNKLIWNSMSISTLVLLCTLITFILVSIATRVLYCYVFRFATGKSRLAKGARFILERLALVDFDSDTLGATLHYVLESREESSVYINELQWIVDKFAVRGHVTSITQINKGYINRTYRVVTMSENGHVHKYTLQRINDRVFHDVELLMHNYKFITKILYGKLMLSETLETGSVPTLRSTKDGRSYYTDSSGSWRMLTYFDDVYSMDIPKSAETFGKAGYAFGMFIKAMIDVDIDTIHEVIPNFHNTKKRYEALEEAIKQRRDGRINDVSQEIEFIRARSDKYGMISDALDSGIIPKRICHNDCNMNNILFDKKTNDPVAIIDLDTVMPSSPLYDFGDSMRIGTNTAKDDEKDLTKVSCDLNMYEQYARGYLKACGDVLTEKELELLPYASLVITVEDGIRFLMDHIEGDIYYNISYPNQNLDRARTQLKLVEDMEAKLPQIKQILRGIYAEYGLQADIGD